MTRRTRNILIGTIVVLLLGVEIAYRSLGDPVGCVQVVNQGTGPIEDLRVECGGRVARVAKVEAGESTLLFLTGRGKQTLKVGYRLKGSALSGFDVTGFDPDDMQKNGFKLVLTIRQAEWERYQDDAEPSVIAGLFGRAMSWLAESLETP